MTQKYTITPRDVIPANLKIFDSYTVSKKKFHSIFKQIHNLHPKSEIWERKEWLMHLEWAARNLCYNLHFFRSHTKDVDLNYSQCFLVKIFYTVFGAIAWLLIK